MSVHVIFYQDGVKMMRPVLTREEYLTLRGSKKQQAILKAVREGDERQKHCLIQMNYSCLPNVNGTLKGATVMSTSVGMDIDHIAAEEMDQLKERILQKKDELGLLMLEMSARKQGYHLVFKRRPELSQEDNLKWASELLGVQYDEGARTLPAYSSLHRILRKTCYTSTMISLLLLRAKQRRIQQRKPIRRSRRTRIARIRQTPISQVRNTAEVSRAYLIPL